LFCPHCGKALSANTQATQSYPPSPPPVQVVVPQQSKSHAGRNAGILLVLLLLFFLLPIVPYTFASYSYLGVNAEATAYVSPSFAVFHCGMVIGVQVSSSYYGYGAYSQQQNPGWVCNGGG
jgi:hypothetical protein